MRESNARKNVHEDREMEGERLMGILMREAGEEEVIVLRGGHPVVLIISFDDGNFAKISRLDRRPDTALFCAPGELY
jgi:hypothetical protein